MPGAECRKLPIEASCFAYSVLFLFFHKSIIDFENMFLSVRLETNWGLGPAV